MNHRWQRQFTIYYKIFHWLWDTKKYAKLIIWGSYYLGVRLQVVFIFFLGNFFVISEFYSFITKFFGEKKLLKLKNENESSLNYKLELSTEHSWFFATDTKSFLSFHRHSYHYPAFFPTEMKQWKDHSYTKPSAITKWKVVWASADKEIKLWSRTSKRF